MKRIILLTFCITQLPLSKLFAQTGPGGVGNASTNVLWLRADTMVYNGAGNPAVNAEDIAAWGDYSGNGKDALQGTSGNRPNYFTNVVNSQPVIRFVAGTSDLLMSTAVTTGNQASVWAVAAFASLPSPNPGILIGAPTGSGTNVAPGNKSIGMWVASASSQAWGRGIESGNTVRDISQTTALSASNFYIINNIYRTAAINQYINNASAGTNNSHNGTLKSWAEVTIGRQGTESWNGDIAEVFFFNFEVNAAQRIIIDNYLAAKYGLTLSSNDLYNLDTPALGNFDFDVAGIGRVNGTNQHLDAQGSGMVRVMNASNLGDNEFLMWGQDNGIPHAINYSDVPSGVVARWDRQWRFKEADASGTGVDVGTVDIRFDLTGYVPIVAADLRLIIDYDNDGIFSDETAISGATVVSGDIFEFTSVPVTNNSRFTIGTANPPTTPLPVELLSFRAFLQETNRVLCTWETSSETNHDYFELQRLNGESEWMSLVTIEGEGRSSVATKQYKFEDVLPSSGAYYYRLKQADLDGTITFSEIISVSQEETFSSLVIYPNPATESLLVQGSALALNPLQLFNMCGQELSEMLQITSTGLFSVRLDLSKLSPGIYLVRCGEYSEIIHKL